MKRDNINDERIPGKHHQITLSTSKEIKPKAMASKWYWEVLPFELREQIFGELQENKRSRWWDNGTTAIVKAFRTLPISYNHILQWFARNGVVGLTDDPWQRTGLYFRDMDVNEVELKSIRNISIDPSELFNYNDNVPTCFTEQFTKTPNIREAYLSVRLDDGMTSISMAVFLTKFPFWLQGFKALTKVTVELPTWSMDTRERNMVTGIIRRIARKTGVQGRLDTLNDGLMEDYEEQAYTRSAIEEAEVWVWEATEGQVMDWTQELGSVYRNPNRYLRMNQP